MLCEEARVRWLTLIEEEDVLIDDISAVVVEIIQDSLNDLTPVEEDEADATNTDFVEPFVSELNSAAPHPE
jgi:hypothetical protein